MSGGEFTDTIFSWSLEDIFNEDLFKDQVELIPDTFRSVGHYFGAFSFPLLEETRSDLGSKLENIQGAPFAEVVSINESIPQGSLCYEIHVSRWRNRFSEKAKDPYRTLPGDVLIISVSKPETWSDLQRAGWTWAFASVTEIIEGENRRDVCSSHFKVKASKSINVKEDRRNSLFVVFLRNVTTNKRIWNVLHMGKNLDIINQVLSTEFEVEEDEQLCCVHSEWQLTGKVALHHLYELDESQRKTILASVARVKCDNKPTVDLIWGPPGTGKTKTISVLLFNLLKIKKRTLVCAPTNVAVNEVGSKVLKLVRKPFDEADSKNDALFCSLGDIILFGNRDRLKLNSATKHIYLDYRADRLIECLGPLDNWNKCLATMIDFLQDCVSQYGLYVENEIIKVKEHTHEDETKNVETLVEYVRGRFKLIAPPVRKCFRKLCTHVPKSLISENNFREIETLVLYLGYLEKMLRDCTLDSEEVEKTFSCEVSKCLLLSKKLHVSLKALHLPSFKSRSDAVDFCFRNAYLILCTASSSYMLHSFPCNPINVLVVDEAAQLKECESLIPLQLSGLRHVILVGDECQLPAMVSSQVSSDAGLGRSLFERLSLLGHPKRLLNMQYRMHPSISFFPNSKFYCNQMSDAPLVKNVGYGKSYLPGPMFCPYSFINVIGGKEDVDDDNRHSRKNMVEVAIVVKIVHNLLKEYEAWSDPKEISIGVVSPYVAQVVAIQAKIGREYKNVKGLTVKVKSIDGFQGGEADIIIISTVRSSASKAIGFLSSPQRINVALTRARHCLWILGNEKTLAGSDAIWKDIINDAKDRHSFFNADENEDLAKAILQVKKDLNQLDDLLSDSGVLFRNAIWKILFSDNFRKSFTKLYSSRKKTAVINLLLRLSNGWRPKNLNVKSSSQSSSPIFNQFKVEGLYVFCTIDLKKEHGSYIQILKVWDLVPLAEIPKLTKRLDCMLAMCTDTYINLCKEKCYKGELEVPCTWRTPTDIVQFKRHETDEDEGTESYGGVSSEYRRGYIENSIASESLLLMKFYRLSSGMVSHLLSDLEGEHVDLPFEVSDEQSEMILYPESTFILGRSGTGKTTVLTMKLLRREEQHYIALEGLSTSTETDVICGSHSKCIVDARENACNIVESKGSCLRQLFVSVSPRLCDAVKRHVSALKRFSRKANFSDEATSVGMDDTTSFEDLPDSFLGMAPCLYPLVVTFRKFLMMLDGTIGNSFFARFSDVKQFSHCKSKMSRSVALDSFLRTKEVTYDRFISTYWVHFNTQLKKQLDPSRVFTEIISHVKGGCKDGKVSEGNLSREDYILLSNKASTLSERIRERIYDLYQDYEKAKAQRGEFDLADLVNDLHHRLQNAEFEGDEMHFVYIDEVQDLTMRQIALFKYICRNVDEGFSFAGDTAQTIARGIDFRFEDIRSLFYSEFLMDSKVKRLGGRNGKRHVSELFCLKQNFRTHHAVLRLAQSVVDLLYCYFRNIIDILDPEESLICGEEPLLLETADGENAIVTIFGNGKNESGTENLVTFGADQVVLVRDDFARKEISAYVGKRALVLTIVECKGLEFQDVLLYNFFGSSPLKNQWRVIYGYMEEHNMIDADSKSFPSFNQSRHNVLCSELKQLYVAITRTRQKLWICENIEEFSQPMFDYWKKKSFVRVKKLDDSFVREMQVVSSAEEWKARGIKLFHEGNYEMATMCFERAGEEMWEKWSKAAGLKETATRMRGFDPERASVILDQAAESFVSIGKADYAAKCYYEWGEHEKAGRIYLEKCGEDKLHEAGECFFLAGCYLLAAELYAKGNYFPECLAVCAKGKLFDVGSQYIHSWKQLANGNNFTMYRMEELEGIEQGFLESCALHHYKLKDYRSMMKFVKVFHSIDSIRNFLKNLDCLDELLLVEKESGNFREAIKIAKLKGDLLLEAELLQKDKHYKEAAMLMLWSVFANSLWVSKSRGWPPKLSSDANLILAKAESLAGKESAAFHEFVSTEVSIIKSGHSLSQFNRYLHSSRKNKSLRGEILSIWKMLDIHLRTHASSYGCGEVWHEDMIDYYEDNLSRNCVTLKTLTFSWFLLKWKFEKIFKCLNCMENQDTNEWGQGDYVDFCLNYFGVLRQVDDASVRYLLLKKDAYWARDIDQRSPWRNGKMVSISTLQFVSAAQTHFRTELLSIGLRLLDTLKALPEQENNYCWPSYFEIFEVAKYLLESKYSIKNHDVKKLRYFLETTVVYFEHVFPLDCRKMLDKKMITLRWGDSSRHFLEDITLLKSGLKGDIMYGKIGRVVLILLSSRKPGKELFHKILKIFEGNSRWMELVNEIGERTYSDNSQDKTSVEKSSLRKLYRASQETCGAIWSSYDYISPISFLYLVDRLLLLSACTRDFFFTMKSSLVEWIISGDSCLNAISGFGDDDHSLAKDIFEFLAITIEQFLFGKISIKEWAKQSGISMSDGYEMVLVRMIIMLCLVCVNSGTFFDILSRVLMKYDSMSSKSMELIYSLRRMDGGNHLIMNANILAEALSKFTNPLVVVSMRLNHPNFSCNKAIFVDMDATLCKKDILRTLFSSDPGQNVEDNNGQFLEPSSSSSDSISNQYKYQIVSSSKNKLPTRFPVLNNKSNSRFKALDGQLSEASSSSSNPISNQCKSQTVSYSKNKPTVFPELNTRTSRLKDMFGGFEAMEPDEREQLFSALDRGDEIVSVSLMHYIMVKQYMLTNDPKIRDFLDGWGNERPSSNSGNDNSFFSSSDFQTKNKRKGKKKGKNEKGSRKK